MSKMLEAPKEQTAQWFEQGKKMHATFMLIVYEMTKKAFQPIYVKHNESFAETYGKYNKDGFIVQSAYNLFGDFEGQYKTLHK
jgi:hypothetical protein